MGKLFFAESAGEMLLTSSDPADQAAALMARLEGFGFGTSGISVSVAGSTVTVSGSVPGQRMAEKIIVALGNVQGVDGVDDDDLSCPPSRGPRTLFHRVRAGETMTSIAQYCFDDADKSALIFAANQPMLTSPDGLYEGQVLIIPAVPGGRTVLGYAISERELEDSVTDAVDAVVQGDTLVVFRGEVSVAELRPPRGRSLVPTAELKECWSDAIQRAEEHPDPELLW